MNVKLQFAGIVAAAVTSLSAVAGAPLTPDQLKQRAEAAQKALDQAERARGAERAQRMDEHMRIMNEVITQMSEMKPRAGMTMREQEQWIISHQQLMESLTGQMMKEHHLLMEKDCH